MRSFTIVFLLCVVGLAQAQQSEPDERWWWAYRDSTGEVVAYNVVGDSKVVLEGVQRYQEYNDTAVFRSVIRVNADTMLAVAKVNGAYGLYRFRLNSVQFMEALPNLEQLAESWHENVAYQFIAIDAPYVVMLHLPTATHDLYVHNIENGDVFSFPINPNFYKYCPEYLYEETMKNCFGISSKEQVIRYVDASTQEDNAEWVLHELNLVTGETRILYKQVLDDIRKSGDDCKPDKLGRRWLCESYREVPEEYGYSLSYYIIGLDGSLQILLENADEQLDDHLGARFSYDNEIIFMDARNDPIKFQNYSLNQTQPETIAINSGQDFIPMPFNQIRRFFNRRILVNGVGHYFLIEPDGWVTYIGDSFCCHLDEPVSADYRWLITTTRSKGDWEWWLWDTQEGRRLFEINGIEVYGRTNFTEFGLIIGKEWVYRYTDSAPSALPAELDGEYHDVLPDGTLLYYQPQATELRETGIYRYNPETHELNLLVADAAPIYIPKE